MFNIFLQVHELVFFVNVVQIGTGSTKFTPPERSVKMAHFFFQADHSYRVGRFKKSKLCQCVSDCETLWELLGIEFLVRVELIYFFFFGIEDRCTLITITEIKLTY